MEEIVEDLDMSKYKYEARIYSKDGKYEKIFTDKEFVDKINQCEHITALYHEKKDIILEVEKILLPLKPRSTSLILETKGGSVVARMSLEDFFILLDLGKRIEVGDRFQKTSPLTKEGITSLDEEIQDLLKKLGDE